MKYKVGDRVKIKSLDWYKENRNNINEVKCGVSVFVPAMTKHCGYIRTISKVFEIQKVYHILEDNDLYTWTDEMIEGLAEEETKSEPKFHIGDWITDGISKCQIHFIDDNQYWYSKFSILGNIESVDKRYHLYTIQDAKDGDILAEDSCIFIIQKLGDNSTAAKTHCTLYDDGDFDNGSILYFDIDSTKPATEEEKQKLFKAIKDNGYEWNPETKTLEKLIEPKFREYNDNKPLDVPTMTTEFVKEYGFPCPEGYIFKDENGNVINATKIVLEKKNKYPKFKVGDRIKRKGDIRLTTIKDIKDNYYIITIPDFFNNAYITDKLLFSNQNEYELFPNKFDITNLRPFDKVLVRGDVGQKWTLDFFGFMDKDKGYPFVCVGHYIIQCIPYEGNECLLGTTNDCDDFYKTWK